MDIEFTPPLGETVHCHVSSSQTRKQSSSVRLHFTATLSNQIASGRLQVWSDIPGNGRHSGEWGETDFRLAPPLPVNKDVAAFSLLPDHDSDATGRNITLTADFVLPTSHGRHFSFTYRMLYPSGEIKWLGQYGQNGTLVLELDSDPVVLLEKDSWVSADNQVYRRDSDGRAVQNLEVARLLPRSDYIAHFAAGEDGLLHPKTSALLVLVPRLSGYPVIVPPTLIFAVPSGSSGSLSFTREGTITISGTSSLTFTAYDSESAEEAISALEDAGINARVLAHAPGHVVIASASNETATAVELAAVPILAGASSYRVIQSTVALRTLTSFLPGENENPDDFFVFEPRAQRARFFPAPEGESGDSEGVLYLTTAPSGGRFVLVPALHKVAQWRVGVVTSAPKATSSSSDSNSALLPTPPPSPRLRPLPHRVSESNTNIAVGQSPDPSPDPSFLSLPAAIASSDEPVPRENANESQGAHQRQLIVHPSKRHAGVLDMLQRVFVVLIAWITRLFGGAVVDTSERRRAGTDERTPLLRHAPEERESAVSGARESGYVEPGVEVVVVSTPERGSSGTQLRPVSFDVGAGKTTLLFKTTRPTAAAGFDVPIALDGRALEVDVLHLEDEGVFVVEFETGGGGRVRVG
ncbi:hypothetical protein B0H16DRAFT_11799 [Mycena metata]|uniref:Uncharacterized protein n=1 Tax=Mycena metata TaxID=1033252 RepID=A0AAD7KHM5_9AGAR|nr:hypothetical protein B0H16DRAFT_11799 [Mycena metata]